MYQSGYSLPTTYQDNNIAPEPNILVRDETSPENKDNANVCLTKECMSVTASIKAAINEDVKPCEDFYEYACGEWMKKNPVPKGKLQVSSFTQLRDENNHVMRESLVKDDEFNNIIPIKKVRTFFQSCLNLKAIDQLGNKPIQKYIKDLNAWAVDEKSGWQADKWDVFETLKKNTKALHIFKSVLFCRKLSQIL